MGEYQKATYEDGRSEFLIPPLLGAILFAAGLYFSIDGFAGTFSEDGIHPLKATEAFLGTVLFPMSIIVGIAGNDVLR